MSPAISEESSTSILWLLRGALVRPRWLLLPAILLLFAASLSLAQNPAPAKPRVGVQSTAATQELNRIIDRVVEGEARLIDLLRYFKPVVETYLQNLQPDADFGMVPQGDDYFLGRLDFSHGVGERSFLPQPRVPLLFRRMKRDYSLQYTPAELSRMVLIDEHIDRRRYTFTFVRREDLGDVRCLLFTVQPRGPSVEPRFMGRMWVEDQDYKIVRFNGTYVPHSRSRAELHIDSWRLNILPKVWFPAFVYSEESDELGHLGHRIRYRAQTRLWGYDLRHAGDHREYTQTLVNNPVVVSGKGDPGQNLSPILSERESPYSTEENIIERLQVAGLMAPDGDVDRVLEQVVTNLLITNNITNLPDVRCRVLLTTPFESFSFGHTIVVSRGLLDVLPNEASLAAIVAHELAHILLGHSADNTYGFNDRTFIPDEMLLQRINFHRDRGEEAAADARAMQLLQRSPYKDQLPGAGLFFRILQAKASALPNLVQPHLGNSWAGTDDARMPQLQALAPELQMKRLDQVAALPLGGRIKLDPWSDRIELMKLQPVAIQNVREKLPLEVTPLFPHLDRCQPEVVTAAQNANQ